MQHELDEAIEQYGIALELYEAASNALDEVTGIGANPIKVIYPLAVERDRCWRRMDARLGRLKDVMRRNRK